MLLFNPALYTLTPHTSPLPQQAAKSGYLCSEPMGWSKLWFVVLNKFLFQFADNNVCPSVSLTPTPHAPPIPSLPVSLHSHRSRSVACPSPAPLSSWSPSTRVPTASRLFVPPFPFSPFSLKTTRSHITSLQQRCAAGVVVLAADSDQDARDWVDAINRDIAGTPVAVAVQPQQALQVQPQAQLPTPQAQPQAQAQPQPQQVPQQMQQQQQMQPQQQVPQPQTANELSPETFWANSFGKLEEVPWAQLVDELSGALGVSLRNSEYYGPVYCIANVVAEGCLQSPLSTHFFSFSLLCTVSPCTHPHTHTHTQR